MRWNEIISESEDGIEVPWNINETNTLNVGSTTIAYDITKNMVLIRNIDTPVEDRGRGQARAALKALCAEADRQKMAMILVSYPQDESTKQDKLNAFYRSLGFYPFSKDPNGEFKLIRNPR
jgi:hypothetical protein